MTRCFFVVLAQSVAAMTIVVALHVVAVPFTVCAIVHSVANMYGAFDVVLYFVIIQLFWLLINLLLMTDRWRSTVTAVTAVDGSFN